MAEGAAVIARFGTVLLRRATRIGERRVEQLAGRLCDQIKVQWPDFGVVRERGRIRFFGRRLRYRWLTDSALRWLGRLLK